MGFGGGSSNAGAPAPPEPKGVPKADPNPKPAIRQNRTEASPLSRPLLDMGVPEDMSKKRSMVG